MNQEFVRATRYAATALAPFANEPGSHALRWNGTGYVPGDGVTFVPSAAKWWATLSTLANLLEHQTAPLSDGQTAYLEKLLFGGMGSLRDFALIEHEAGPGARQANQQLDDARRAMREAFA
jgi:hypothetical protein